MQKKLANDFFSQFKSSDLDVKGGLISEIFYFGTNLKKWVPNHSSEHYSPKKMLREVIWHFGDLSQSEKLSEINPTLVHLQNPFYLENRIIVAFWQFIQF